MKRSTSKTADRSVESSGGVRGVILSPNGDFSGEIGDAIARVEAEKDHVGGKQTAYDRFEKSVRELWIDDGETIPTAARATGGGAAAVSPMTGRRDDDPCRQIRERFGATVRPYSIEDVEGTESVVATIREELGERIALALSPNGSGQLTPRLRDGIRSSIDDRRSELRAMSAALDRERTSLREAEDGIEAAVDRIRRIDGRYLYRCGFGELCERHERLGTCRERCNRLAHERQATLASTTSHGARAGVDHRTLTAYLYRDLPTKHPVLTAILGLDSACIEAQRALRDQLTRRV